MKKTKLISSLLVIGSSLALISCSGRVKDKIHKLADYVYEVDTYTQLDYDYADKFWAENNDNWGGGCSAVTKIITDEAGNAHRIIGRNMDLNISNKCAYIVRTNAGSHKTVGLAYTHRDYSPDYAEVEKDGISEHFYKILPFICDDVLNDSGLHIEVNMRHAECFPDGSDMFSLEHSNPANYEGKRRVHMFELTRYIGENCSTVEEAKKYIANNLDIYSKFGYWNYCFIISDNTGASSLVEFNEIGLCEAFGIETASRVSWIDDNKESLDKLSSYLKTGPIIDRKQIKVNALAQTNFYLNKYAWIFQDTKSGEGRFIALQNGINNVTNKTEMFNLMDKVAYHWFYESYRNCMENHFDPRTENVGEAPGLTYGILFNPEFQEYIENYFNYYAINVWLSYKSRQAKRDANKFWETTFTEVVDCFTKSIVVRIFEEESIYCNITLDKTEVVSKDNFMNYLK